MHTPAALLPPAIPPAASWPRPHPIGWLIGGTLVAALAGTCAIVAISGMRLDLAEFARFAAMALSMAGLWAWCWVRGLDRRVGDAALIVGIGTLALMACGIISNVGLRLGAPPIDPQLVIADSLIGIDVESAVRSFVEYPALIDILAFAYKASGLAVIGLIAWTLARGWRTLTWELVATVVLAMQVVAIISIAVPAVGAMAHLGMLDLQGHGLPVGAGTYHLQAFARFHAGDDPAFVVSDMSGLVTFPSFHTVLALLATQAVAHTRARWFGVAWTATVIVSTIPIGGHYATDLIAGFAIWAGCAAIARLVSSPSA